MSRVQLALRVADLEGSIDFYRSLFGVEPAKRRPGYANFAVPEPPLKLVLIEGEPGEPTVLDHLGVEVETTDEVHAATARLSDLGLFTRVEDDTTCCYALQDKVWVHGPGREPWEVYTVKADASSMHPADAPTTGACECGSPAGLTAETPAACC
ncbi:ArsI/CadI family heavy metal resistance metalloenzyme [Pseudonocardia pini]|uniref:ArsI/CadI family heavy metal resistance metalloenzyme n=1 Tax=Pseudonocardia pini TaxID=2758030 RepID=UPI0015F038A0|nr:ArsI/CadI family heavy metal resistance metalloenzyme [Pseudonocardia pini]